MDHSHLSPAEAEAFFTEGSPAWPPQSPAHAERVLCTGCRQPVSESEPCPECGTDNRAKKEIGAAESACDLIDVPGVGPCLMADCSGHRAPVNLRPARAYSAGDVPSPLREMVGGESFPARQLYESEIDEERDRLLAKLLFAAKALAERNLAEPHVLAVFEGHPITTATCRECYAGSLYGKPVQHTEPCRTGRVLGIVDELMALNERRAQLLAPKGGAK